MASDWREVRLGDVVNLKRGYDLPKRSRKLGDVPVVSSSGISGSHNEAKVAGPGVVTGRYGTIGQVYYVEGPFWPLNTTLYVQDFKGNRPRYIRYLLETLDFHQFSDKAAVPGVNRNHLHEAHVLLPPPKEQECIERSLSILERRIDNLRQTNATLEAIAQALFKSWFVDFDPVRAKAEGREPEGMDDATAALFPSEFEDSGLGPIPKGWLVTKLSNLCAKIQNGGTPSRSNPAFWEGGEIPWFKTGELSDGFLMNPSERITRMALDKTSVKVLPKHSVLMAIYAAPTVGRLGVLSQESAFNQACTGMVAKDKVGPWFLFHTLKQGRDWYNDRANGAAQQNISKAIVEDLPCVQPQQPALDAFTDVAQEIYGSIEENSRRAITLSTLRDTLLPRLISGKLRLPDAAREIEAATA